MKKAFLLKLLLFCFTSQIWSLSDLVVTAIEFSPSNIDKGDIFRIDATISNIGNSTAVANYLFIYFSKDLTLENSEIISRVSIKQLGPGLSQEISFIYPISEALVSGNYYIGLEIDPYGSVQEDDEENLFCASNTTGCITFKINNAIQRYQKYTYPILFIHGWTGNDKGWDLFTDTCNLFYGWSYGGRLDYCLNPDDDQSTSDGFIYPFTSTNNLRMGDYYYINFDVSTNGEPYVGNDGIPFNDDYSNQSAIVKQGWAIKDAVKKVLTVSGASKVILVGHSMGGLAAREYIQNQSNWQSDGNHHVAKILTIGTPNGGSNFDIPGLNLLGWGAGYDIFSEAVRDLRYPSILFGGQYLFGGTESTFSIFHNNDINCNGIGGNLIIGLNEKTSPLDISYSCIISPDDWIVDIDRADLNNYLMAAPPFSPPYSDKFTVGSGHLEIHKENHPALIRGLDEPFSYNQAYEVPMNSLNFGFCTQQASNNPLPPPNNTIDLDQFKFTVPVSGEIEIGIWNIPVQNFSANLLNSAKVKIHEISSKGESNIHISRQVAAGTYYLELGGVPTTNSWRFPYGYSITFTPSSGLVANFQSNIQEGCSPLTVSFSNQSGGNPTSFLWNFPGGTPSSSTQQNPSVVYNTPGIYSVSLTINNNSGNNSITKNSFIKINGKPTADFDYSFDSGNSVKFINKTNQSGLAQNYSWNFGDNNTSTEFSPSHKYANNGTYSVLLIAANSCGNTLKSKNISVTLVNTENKDGDSKILVYPNPNNGSFILKLRDKSFGNYEVKIINTMGQTMEYMQINKTAEEVEHTFSLKNLARGIYIIQITSSIGEQYLKVIIDK